MEGRSKGAATNISNQAREFFQDNGSILWITFVGPRLYWGFLAPSQAEPHTDGNGVWRKVVEGWRFRDVRGEQLTKEKLSGALTQLASFRGTSCEVGEDEYVVRRINGRKLPDVESAISALDGVCSTIPALLKLLGPRDFELLVDLIFSTSGWRRLGDVGKTEKTSDLDLLLPSTGERAFVQVKSQTKQGELDAYIEKLDELSDFHRMFFVYHSGHAHTNDSRVTVIGPQKLAELVVDSGLMRWLINKVS